MTPPPLNVLIVEDEALLAAELDFIVREAGCRAVGHAMSAAEAMALARALTPDLALVDVHLLDGATGIDVAREIANDCGGVVLFMTANVRRLPADLAGACGVIGKPYSDTAVKVALCYLTICLRTGQALGPPPLGLVLSPAFEARWNVPRRLAC